MPRVIWGYLWIGLEQKMVLGFEIFQFAQLTQELGMGKDIRDPAGMNEEDLFEAQELWLF